MKQDEFNTLREVISDPMSSQRKLASNLGFSLGKLNYCLNALRAKGLVKLQNFRNNKNKVGYAYLITPKGISEKTKLTIKFMKLKMKEYDELRQELKNQNKNLISKKTKR